MVFRILVFLVAFTAAHAQYNPSITFGAGTMVVLDTMPEQCQSKLYEWSEDSFKCVGTVVQDSGLPLFEPGFRTALLEAQRNMHLAAQNMYRFQANAYLTPEYLDFKNAETLTKIESGRLKALQDKARAICDAAGSQYDGPKVACVKKETGMGLISKALSRKEKP